MTTLVEIIAGMLTAADRVTRELPRGLWLVYYPLAQGELEQPGRLIAARHLSTPSPTELQTVRFALLDALDHQAGRVLFEIVHEWTPVAKNDWDGYAIDWTTLPAAVAFSRDPDLARRFRLALERREARESKRRKTADQPDQPAANSRPLL